MGCGHSSKLEHDEGMSAAAEIEPVFGGVAGGCTNRRHSKHGDKYALEEREARGNNKAAKRAKYDPRITAKYEVKALIGKGSYTRVVRAQHRLTKQPVALKMMDSADGREAFEAELTVLRRVKHPYIVHLVEVFDVPVKPCLVMELATGGDLFDRIVSRGSFTEYDATCVLRMIVDGVGYLHSLGITHRDLKPDNLLYYHPGHDSKILITDFGLAAVRKPSGDLLMRTACGTPEYIAPEIVSRKPYSCAVDMWAVGVIAYVLLSGTFPFDDVNRIRLYKLILRAKFSYAGDHWLDISEAAKDFIDHLLIVNPEDRMSAAEALQHAWIVSNASSSLNKNLQRSISQNLFKTSTRSSSRSSISKHSTRSNHSQKSGHRVCARELQNLQEDIEVCVNPDHIFSQPHT